MISKTKIGVYKEISLKEIADEIDLEKIPHKDLINFIKRLDRDAEDWGVTETLYEYFKKLHDRNLKENSNNSFFESGKYKYLVE